MKTILSIPVDALKWKTVDDHVLNTPLGTEDCTVEVLDTDKYRVLKPGEDDRIRKLQAKAFREWLVHTGGKATAAQVKYLGELFGF